MQDPKYRRWLLQSAVAFLNAEQKQQRQQLREEERQKKENAAKKKNDNKKKTRKRTRRSGKTSATPPAAATKIDEAATEQALSSASSPALDGSPVRKKPKPAPAALSPSSYKKWLLGSNPFFLTAQQRKEKENILAAQAAQDSLRADIKRSREETNKLYGGKKSTAAIFGLVASRAKKRKLRAEQSKAGSKGNGARKSRSPMSWKLVNFPIQRTYQHQGDNQTEKITDTTVSITINGGSEPVAESVRDDTGTLIAKSGLMGHALGDMKGMPTTAIAAPVSAGVSPPSEDGSHGAEAAFSEYSRLMKICQRAGDTPFNPVFILSHAMVLENYAALNKRRSSDGSAAPASNGSLLWTQRYRPLQSRQICGNQAAVSRLHVWLEDWLSTPDDANSLKSSSIWDSDYVDPDDVVEGNNSMGNVLSIVGPVGSGKSASIYACAEELGFEVIEINASSVRGRKQILAMFGEATQSHRLALGDSSNAKPSGTAQAKGRKKTAQQKRKQTSTSKKQKAKRNPPQKKSKKQTLILLEEVDQISFFEDHGDRGLFSAVRRLAATSKRPIILTANTLTHELRELQIENICFMAPRDPEIALTLHQIATAENLSLSYQALCSFVHRSGSDLRRSIHQMQFWTQGIPTDPAALATITEFSGTGVESPTGRRALDVILGTAGLVSPGSQQYWCEVLPTSLLKALSPRTSSVEPNFGSCTGGCEIVITGSNFRWPGGSDLGALRVYLGDVECTDVRVVADTTIIARSPALDAPPLFPVPVIVTRQHPRLKFEVSSADASYHTPRWTWLLDHFKEDELSSDSDAFDSPGTGSGSTKRSGKRKVAGPKLSARSMVDSKSFIFQRTYESSMGLEVCHGKAVDLRRKARVLMPCFVVKDYNSPIYDEAAQALLPVGSGIFRINGEVGLIGDAQEGLEFMQRMSSPMTVDFSICIPTRYVRVVLALDAVPNMLFRLDSVSIRTKSFRCLAIAKTVDSLELPEGACLVQVDALPVVGDTGLNKFMSYISKRRRIHATFAVHDVHGEWTPAEDWRALQVVGDTPSSVDGVKRDDVPCICEFCGQHISMRRNLKRHLRASCKRVPSNVLNNLDNFKITELVHDVPAAEMVSHVVEQAVEGMVQTVESQALELLQHQAGNATLRDRIATVLDQVIWKPAPARASARIAAKPSIAEVAQTKNSSPSLISGTAAVQTCAKHTTMLQEHASSANCRASLQILDEIASAAAAESCDEVLRSCSGKCGRGVTGPFDAPPQLWQHGAVGRSRWLAAEETAQSALGDLVASLAGEITREASKLSSSGLQASMKSYELLQIESSPEDSEAVPMETDPYAHSSVEKTQLRTNAICDLVGRAVGLGCSGGVATGAPGCAGPVAHVALDVVSHLRAVCRAEQLRKEANQSRRFTHYLDTRGMFGIESWERTHLATQTFAPGGTGMYTKMSDA